MRQKGKKSSVGSKIINFLLALIMIVGLSLLLYPTVSDWWNQFHQSRAIASYSEYVSSIDPAEYAAYIEEAHTYNEYLWTMPNRYIPTEEEHQWYESILNVTGNGIMGYIKIPKINVNLPIYHGVEDVVLQIAVGHIEGTSLPVGGEGVHTVLSGHRGLPSAKLFTDLDQLLEGDIFTLTVLNETITYEIDQIRIVLPAEVDTLTLEEGQDYCTLVTCTPYGINSHRMLVRGRRIENLAEEIEVVVTADAKLFEPLKVAPLIAAPILVILFITMMFKKPVKKITAAELARRREQNRKQKKDEEQQDK